MTGALGLSLPRMSARKEAWLDDFIEPSLRHHRYERLRNRAAASDKRMLSETAYAAFSAWRSSGIDPASTLDEIGLAMKSPN